MSCLSCIKILHFKNLIDTKERLNYPLVEVCKLNIGIGRRQKGTIKGLLSPGTTQKFRATAKLNICHPQNSKRSGASQQPHWTSLCYFNFTQYKLQKKIFLVKFFIYMYDVKTARNKICEQFVKWLVSSCKVIVSIRGKQL